MFIYDFPAGQVVWFVYFHSFLGGQVGGEKWLGDTVSIKSTHPQLKLSWNYVELGKK